MIWRITWRLLAALLVLALIGLGGAFAVLKAPQLAEVRTRIASDLLVRYLGEAVTVSGEVAVTFGSTIDVTVHGVSPVADASADKPVGRVRLSFAREAALRGRLALTALDVAGIRVIIDAGTPSPSKAGPGERFAAAVEQALSSPLVRQLEIEDLEIRRINDPAGWNGALHLDDASARAADTAGLVDLSARGNLNGEPFTLKGQAPDLAPDPEPGTAAASGDNLSVSLALKGIEAALTGRLARGKAGVTVTAELKAESRSLGDLQELLQLARVVEGNGSLTMTLDGPLAQASAGSLKLHLQDAAGRTLEADGSLSDLWALDGVELSVSANLAKAPASKKAPLSAAPRAIQGRLSRQAGAFEIDEVLVQTDLAAVELETIGPIRIGALARDDEGRLQLRRIRLVQGDAKDPELDLTAHLDDTLALRGFALAGRFSLDMGGLLTGRPAGADLGRLRGEVALSDASGRLRFETLTAELARTPLMSLSLALDATQGANAEPRVGVDLSVQIPDLAPVASALGGKAESGFPVAFDGRLGAEDGAVTVNGSARLGRSALEGRIAIGLPKRTPEITGHLHAKALHLDDLLAAAEMPTLVGDRAADRVTLNDDIAETPSLDLDVSADSLQAAGVQVDDLAAHLAYGASKLDLSGVEFTALGGRISGEASADLAAAPPGIRLQGQVRRLNLEQLFRQLGSTPAASGPLDLDLAVTARGGDLRALLGSLSGKVSGSLRNGVLANRTIDLAGQNIIAWVFTRSADGSAPLECLVARFDFAQGVGTAETLVFETDKVQVVGSGRLDLRDQVLDLVMVPRPKRNELIGKVGHVTVTGLTSQPRVSLAPGAVTEKVLGDTLGLPLHLLGAIVGADGRLPAGHRPCVVVPGPVDAPR